MDIDNIALEIKALQKKDTEDALNSGFKNKQAWFKHIINSDTDEVAKAILDLSKRYDVSETVIANYFDPTMIVRLIKIKNQDKKITI